MRRTPSDFRPWPRRMPLAICLALLSLAPARMGWALNVLPHSFSRSRQFVIYARDSALRGAVGTVAEEAKARLSQALGLPDERGLPIIIDLRAPEPGMNDARTPVQLILAQTDTGLKIELHLTIGDTGHGTRIHDELVRAILLEVAYRNKSALKAGQSYTLPPSWLVEGFSAYFESLDNGVSAGMFAALLPTTQTLPISDFIRRDPATMDSTSHAVYRAYAYDLVCLLVRDMEGGKAGMLSFIRDLPNLPADEARDAGVLSQHFPQLAATPDAVEKWWVLGLAKLAAADRFQAYSVAETEEKLQALMTFPGPATAARTGPTKVYDLSDFEVFTPLKHNAEILSGLRVGLIDLSGRANPLTQNIVAGYQAVVETLIRQHTKGIGEKLHELAAARVAVLKRQENIADYDNWFEATQLADQSGAFDSYFHAARQLDKQAAAHRPDAISAYLDEVDAELR